jgi:hypothetical protein
VRTEPSSRLEADAREGVAVVLDVLLPGTAALPSGRAVGAHRELLDRVLAADPTLEAVVTLAGERAWQHGSCSLGDLSTWAGEDLERVVFALHAAYYLSPDVRAALGYPGQGRRPIGLATAEERVDDELIAPVLARGPLFVPTPDDGQ